MSQPDLVFRSSRVVTPEAVGPASVHVRDGIIVEVVGYDEVPDGVPRRDCGDAVIFPGVVDTHVHVNEPGRTEWEGFESATCAAAAGGVTTLVDMPLNSVPATTNVKSLNRKIAAAEGRCRVDVGFWGGVVPGNASRLRRLRAEGVLGFKCFLVPSGVDEFPHVGEADLDAALPILAELEVPLLVHAELPGPLAAAPGISSTEARRYASYLASRPAEAEVEAVRLLVRLCDEHRAPVHVVHLSAAEALPALFVARERGLPVTVETCPHYLTFDAEEIPDGGTEWKCAPPIRGRDNRERLWAALADRRIDLVASDHSPSPPERKHRDSGDFGRAWGGIASLQVALAAVWTESRRRGHSLLDLAEWMCRAPARLAGLAHRKGAIARGCDADLVVLRPEAAFRVDPERLFHRHKLTPWAGRELHGVVEQTYLRGERVYDRGKILGEPMGKVLRK